MGGMPGMEECRMGGMPGMGGMSSQKPIKNKKIIRRKRG